MESIMKNYLKQWFFVLATMLLAFSAFEEVYAEKEVDNGGTSFWVGMPRCNRSKNEKAFGTFKGNYIELFITARDNANVRIYNSKGVPMGSPIKVKGGGYEVVGLNLEFMEHKTSCKVEDKGVYIESDMPISVVFYVGFNWTGEAYRCVPNDWLGTEYYTMNLYNDFCKMQDGTVGDFPNQIMIIADEDNTTVQYTPTYNIQNGVKAGQTGEIHLNRGQSVVLFSEINIALRQDESTDLTGTHIKADKKIAVYSGHTKGSFPQFAPTYYNGLKADFFRNMLFEAMWPVELLGKEYVTTPYIYEKRIEYQNLIADEKGEIVRVIATKNNTRITEVLANGQEEDVIVLKKGEYFDFNNGSRTTPLYFKASYPVLVGQYAKGYMWWRKGYITTKEGEDGDKDENELQNPDLTGQGFLVSVTPNEQWSNYASFLTVNKVNNNVNIIFRTDEGDKIKYWTANKVKKVISEEFTNYLHKIPGTPFSYIAMPLSPGTINTFEGDSPNIVFSCYAYGDMDAYKSGFSYGYPTSARFSIPCNDSIYIEENIHCNIVEGKVIAMDLQEDPKCATIAAISFEQGSRENATFQPVFEPGTQTGSFKVIFKDKNKEGKITVKAKTKSGTVVKKEYVYYPDVVSADIKVHKFGVLEPGKPANKEVVVTNEGKAPVKVKKIYLKLGESQFTLQTPDLTDFTLAPQESKTVNVQVLIENGSLSNVREELWVETECNDVKVTDLVAGSGSPDVMTTDLNFGIIPITVGEKTKTMEFEIVNNGNNPSNIIGYTRTNNLKNFECTDLDKYNESNPLVLKPNEKIKVKVKYSHFDESGVEHIDTLKLVSTNTTITKLYSAWKAMPIKGNLTVTSYDWGKQRTIDNYTKSKNLPERYDATLIIANNGTNNVKVKDIKIFDGESTNEITWVDFKYSETKFDELKEKVLAPEETFELPVYFIPLKQKAYATNVVVYGEYGSDTKVQINSNKGLLNGSGIKPHSYTEDVKFGVLNLDKPEEKTRTKDVVFEATAPVVGFEQDLTITGLKFNNGTYYKIDPSFTVPTEANPVVLKVGEKLTVPVIFSPDGFKSGGFNDALTIISDVNINPPADEPKDVITANLSGNALATDINVTNTDFGTQYINLQYGDNDENFVSFKNNSSEGTSLYLTDNVDQLFAKSNPEGTAYTINKVWIDNKNNIKTPYEDIELLPNQTIYVSFLFKPTEVKKYDAEMKFSYSLTNDKVEYEHATAYITGAGKEYRAVVEIAKGHEAKPGEFAHLPHKDAQLVEVKLNKAQGETKPFADAKIRYIELQVKIGDNEVENDDKTKHFYPYSENNDYNLAVVTEGTMTEGWRVEFGKVDNATRTFSVLLSGKHAGKILEDGHDNVLCKLKLLGYLSTANVIIPFKPSAKADNIAEKYTTITSIDGDGKILEVCLDDQRLIEFSGKNYKVSAPTPNPVVSTSTIEYTTAIDAPVLIELYDLSGAKVATLVNEYKKAGDYKLEVDVDALGLSSGSYNYRVEMGPYSTVKTIVITK